MIDDSPLFPVQEGDTGHMLQITKNNELLSVKMLKRKFEDGTPFDTVEEAEDYYFSLAPEPAVTFDLKVLHEYNPSGTYIGDIMATLAVIINRQANIISQKTQRGAGNKVFVNKAGLHVLEQGTTSAFATISEDESKNSTALLGRWKFVGKLNNAMDVYFSPHLPNSKIYVVYSETGKVASNAVLLKTNGKYSLILGEGTQVQANDYIRAIGINPLS